jgi:hypothetical protein
MVCSIIIIDYQIPAAIELLNKKSKMLGQINILCIKKKRKRKRKQQIKKKILPQYIRSHLLEGI